MALASTATAQLGLVLAPALADRAPLVLLALRPQLEFVILLSPQVPPFAAVAVVAPLRWLIHLVYVEVGRWAGRGPLYETRAGRWIATRLERPRISVLLLCSCLVHPGTPIDLALGAGGVDRRRVAVVLAAGSLLTTTLFVAVGEVGSHLSEQALGWLTEHRGGATVACAALALISVSLSRRALRRARTGGMPGTSVNSGQPDRRS